MKKVNKSRPEPEILANFREENPNASWKAKKETRKEGSFKSDAGKGQIDVYNQILANQGGLCAYCEVDLIPNGVGKKDFRVEHFHPEGVVDGHNYSLDWDNLLGVCHGGSEKDVVDQKRRYTPDNHRCDVPKGSKNWVGEILNPLTDIPAFPSLFEFERLGDGSMDDDAGKIKVDDRNYPPLSYPELYVKAKKSIKRLNLNAPRLREFRLTVLIKLEEQLDMLTANYGFSEDEAYEELALQELTPSDDDGHWKPFFTCIRWRLADKAEEHLQKINYNG